MDKMEFADLTKTVAISMILMTSIGTITNAVTCLVCLRKALRKVPTFVFIAFKTVIDIIPFYSVNLDFMIQSNLISRNIADSVPSLCILQYFVYFFPLQSSAWLLVAISLESFLSVQIKSWRKKWFDSKKAALVSIIIIGIFFVANFYLNFGNEFQKSILIVGNETVRTTRCARIGDIVFTYSRANTYVYLIFPFVLLVITNGLCVYKTHKSKKATGSKDQNSQVKKMTTLIVIKTLLFLVFTAPMAIANGFYSDDLKQADILVILKYLNMWRFIHHSTHLYILYLCNVKFRNEFLQILRFAKINIIYPATSTTVPTQSINKSKSIVKSKF